MGATQVKAQPGGRALRLTRPVDAVPSRWWRSDAFISLALMSPAFIFIVVMLLASLATLVLLSFRSDTEAGAIARYTLDNYRTIFSPDGDMYRALLVRSMWIPLFTTVAVVLCA